MGSRVDLQGFSPSLSGKKFFLLNVFFLGNRYGTETCPCCGLGTHCGPVKLLVAVWKGLLSNLVHFHTEFQYACHWVQLIGRWSQAVQDETVRFPNFKLILLLANCCWNSVFIYFFMFTFLPRNLSQAKKNKCQYNLMSEKEKRALNLPVCVVTRTRTGVIAAKFMMILNFVPTWIPGVCWWRGSLFHASGRIRIS